MALLERHIQKIRASNLIKEWEQSWIALEKRLGGFPDKRYYELVSGTDPMGTMVWEREWETFATMDAAYQRMFQDPEASRLGARAHEVITEERLEYYAVRDI